MIITLSNPRSLLDALFCLGKTFYNDSASQKYMSVRTAGVIFSLLGGAAILCVLQWSLFVAPTLRADLFNVSFTCNGSECDLIENEVHSGLHRISTVLMFENVLKINVTISEQDEVGEYIGLGWSGQFYPVNVTKSGPNGPPLGIYFFPQALVKEMLSRGTLRKSNFKQFNEFDMVIIIKKDNWKQGSVEYVFIHEFLHGLGFGTHFIKKSSSKAALLPRSGSNGTCFQFYRPALWTSFLAHSNGIYITEDLKLLYEIGLSKCINNEEGFETSVLSHSEAKQAAESIYESVNSNSGIVFKTKTEIFPIYTSKGDFNFSSVMSHTSIGKSNFIMDYSVNFHNLTFLSETFDGSGIGQKIISILEFMGYRTVRKNPHRTDDDIHGTFG